MRVYGIALAARDADGRQEGPSINDVLGIRLTWNGMKRQFRRLDWKKEIIEHLIWIDERDMYEAVNVKIEETENTLSMKDYMPKICAYVEYSVKNKVTGAIELERKINVMIAPIWDAKI